jgi:hypothetical protein
MLGVIYLILSSLVGYFLVKFFFPNIFNPSNYQSLNGKKIKLSAWMIVIPASFLTGTLVVTWFTYIAAYLFRETGKSMFYGNIVAFIVFSLGLVAIILIERKALINKFSRFSLKEDFKIEFIFVVVVTLFWGFFCFHTFYIKNNLICAGYSVFSDFAPHLAVIRSFSLGNNFPTQYPHFADGTIRYHFMFQFLAGNLEFLGLRLDWAFNLPSILSMVAFLMLLYSLAVILFGYRRIGILATVFFFFRSSFAFFTYMSTMKGMELGSVIKAILNNDKSIGGTMHEDWGLWAQKLYANQRHLLFALAMMLLLIIVIYPLFTEMVSFFKESRDKHFLVKVVGNGTNQEKVSIFDKNGIKEEAETISIDNNEAEETSVWVKLKIKISMNKEYFKAIMKGLFFSKDAWIPQSYKRCVFAGIVLGLMGFWNGAVVIGLLLILFIMAIYSKHRLEYLVIACIAGVLLFLQSSFFISQGKSVLAPQIYIGFLAETKNISGILNYYMELLGILPAVIILSMFILPRGGKWLLFAFSMPFVLANTLSLTPDIVVNHKYVVISVILLNIFAAYLIVKLFEVRLITVKIIIIGMVVVMTITGVVDIISLYNLDKDGKAVCVKIDDHLLRWTEKNVNSDEVLLTDMYGINPILMAGRKIFYGWPYYAWSAGYDTDSRFKIVKKIYSGSDFNTVDRIIKDNKISFVVIDNGNRSSKDYQLNEELFKENYPEVYNDTEAGVSIYKTIEK